MAEWMPIETAPKDGTSVLLWHEDYRQPFTGEWFEHTKWGNAWNHTYATQPTHWMTLPPPPSPSVKQVSGITLEEE